MSEPLGSQLCHPSKTGLILLVPYSTPQPYLITAGLMKDVGWSRSLPQMCHLIGLGVDYLTFETQLARVQQEKTSMYAQIDELLANLRTSGLEPACSECTILESQLRMQKKLSCRWRRKFQRAEKTRVKLERLQTIVETVYNNSPAPNPSNSKGDALVHRDVPDSDLLGGTIPSVIAERYSVAFLDKINPPSAASHNLFDDFLTSKIQPPSPQYLPTHAESKDVGREKKHIRDLAISTCHSCTDGGSSPVAGRPHVSTVVETDDLPLSLAPETAWRTRSSITPSSYLEGSPQVLAGNIRWALEDGIHDWNDRLFVVDADRENAIVMHCRSAGREDVVFPDLFRYGIRYNPRTTTQNVYRTILIEGLPRLVTCEEALKNVCGGLVLSIKLCDTYSVIGSCSALVTFLTEAAAHQYRDLPPHMLFMSPA